MEKYPGSLSMLVVYAALFAGTPYSTLLDLICILGSAVLSALCTIKVSHPNFRLCRKTLLYRSLVSVSYVNQIKFPLLMHFSFLKSIYIFLLQRLKLVISLTSTIRETGRPPAHSQSEFGVNCSGYFSALSLIRPRHKSTQTV